jgi:hypothetical protein
MAADEARDNERENDGDSWDDDELPEVDRPVHKASAS